MPGELSYRTWHDLAPSFAAGANDTAVLRRLLQPLADGIVYVQQDEAGKLWTKFVALWCGDAGAMRAYLECADTTRSGPKERKRFDAVVPIRIGDHLDDDDLIDGIRIRLETLAPYDPDTLPDAPPFVWYIQDIYRRWGFIIEDGRMVNPPGWSWNGDAMLGPIFCGHRHLRVIDGDGRMGLMHQDGRVSVPCSYAYLSEPDRNMLEACEACLDHMPDVLGLCDIVDANGKRTNPPGVKALAGTLWWGVANAVRESDGASGLLGLLSFDGRLLCDFRWQEISEFWGGYGRVLDSGTGLWGYINEEGEMAIAPRFASAGYFNHGFAVVALPGSEATVGLIDEAGRMVVEPRWESVKFIRGGHFMVTTADDRYGIVDAEGQFELEPRGLTEEEQRGFDSFGAASSRHPFHKLIVERMRERVARILEDRATLAPLAGVFSSGTSERDLQTMGLWGKAVEVVADRIEVNRAPVRAGERGTIGFSYPVTASIFNFSVEAPVEGLAVLPNASVGVPWALLRLV